MQNQFAASSVQNRKGGGGLSSHTRFQSLQNYPNQNQNPYEQAVRGSFVSINSNGSNQQQQVNTKGLAKSHMMRKMKEMRDLENNEAKLTLLENTLSIVEQNRATLGKVKIMSSLEKNRIALNLISSLKHQEANYNENKQKNIAKNIKYQQDEFNRQFYKKFGQNEDYESNTQNLRSLNAQSSYNPTGNIGGSKLLQSLQDMKNRNSMQKSMQNTSANHAKQMLAESLALQRFQDDMENEQKLQHKDTKHLKRNVSVEILKQKQMSVGDPLTHFGIMTLNNNIPYKKPILKSMPVFVNARGVIQDLEQNHGGLHFLKNSPNKNKVEVGQKEKRVKNLNITNSNFIRKNLRRVHSAKPKKFRSLLHSRNPSSPIASRPLSPKSIQNTLSHSRFSRNFENSGGPLFSNLELKQSIKRTIDY
ncbi:UNKNOWN [Stylonychia lemnae]|uniref:Uncharacterized protein n=1 Tax=Stylonychia lemnae TaxID=5949 RepID=A0A078AA82_STYLE|nr:UNKNOWN [Stylonychia lemnae]|eukprot:CDW77723.1 UNKNOWN [Stylonychia lemnae]